MFYWMRRSCGGLGGPGGLEGSGGTEPLGDMSKTEILRGIVTEKLTTAAQEILAVVERTVAGYEEEASGFRREIDRQRRQLELLLQPQVKLERRALLPDLDGHDVVVVGDGEEEEQEEKRTQQPDVDDAGSLDLLWYDEDDYKDFVGDDDEDEDERLPVRPGTSSRKKRADLRDPDYQIPSRSFSPRAPSERRKLGRPRVSDATPHVDLRIRILRDAQTDVLSRNVFRTCPLQELQCPRGLRETDFLRLLRSTFPQLPADEPFDFFTTDRSRRLHSLRVRSLTPEEIQRSIRSTGAGRSTLYIRLKTGDEPQTSDDLNPLQRRDNATDDSPSSSVVVAADQTKAYASSSSPRVQSEKKRRGRPRLGDEPSHHYLRICVLEDSQSEVLSRSVLMRSPVQHLKCPRGLQQSDFLDLLRSTFPRLAGDDESFDLFRSDRSRRLQRLRVQTLTPEEICRNLRSTGSEKTLIYIRQKTGDAEEELQLFPMKDDVTEESPSTVAMVIKDEAGKETERVDVQPSSSTPRPENVETDHEDAASDRVASRDDDWEPHVDQRPPKTPRRTRLSAVERSKTPCRVCGVWYRVLGSLVKHAWSHADESQAACGVCGERFESAEELKRHLRNYQKTYECSYCGKTFSNVAGLNLHATLHTGARPFACDICKKTFARQSSLSVHRWVHVPDKPHKCDTCPKAFGLKTQLKAHRKLHTGRDKYQCNICGKVVFHLRSLTRHKVTHTGERRYGCEVCGKRFKLPSTLKSHEKIHTVRERPYLCDVCCKAFHSNGSLAAHMRTHGGERPFACAVCGKGFVSNGERNAHMRVHTGEAPHGCSECGRFFKRKTHLTNHIRSHLGIKLFACPVCGKACSRQEHLTVHMRTHNGERPYQCSVCDKAFTQSHCLKTHMKSHRAREDSSESPSTS
ncbi:zinc finger protein 432 isoform X1 [Scophthalmus maximus]|uniref:zinc finger protein 432 isoform X1 n=1 Tax=Scophthalmus maximus TaxID=52904 RepID=UPI001FA93611|nr:zinc finger protein 432 isoform X1 [Scophthalmus maximus]